jgi:hypothetical protein
MVFIPTPFRVPAIWKVPPDVEMLFVVHERGGPVAFTIHAREQERELMTLARMLKCKPFEVADRITKLLAEIETNEVTLARLREKLGP